MAQLQKSNPNAIKLCSENLKIISQAAEVPQYDRESIQCGIMHMSVGGFHRSHQAVYLDDVLATGQTDWAICGVGLLPQDKEHIQALQDQDGLYTVLERNAQADTARVIGSMKEVLHAPSNPQAIIDRLMDSKIRILSLTITEKGYCYDTSGNLDQSNQNIQSDLKNSGEPKTAYGYIIAALKARMEQNMPPFTIMSCDNLPGNGDLTRKLVLQFADLVDSDLSAWIADQVSFPNAMVDRITPVTTDEIVDLVRDKFLVDDGWPVVCEDYIQWVLEDKFGNGRPPLEKVGVQVVEDVEPYEKMKVRLLNGSHSALAYVSYLMGYRDVDKAMADPLIAKFTRLYMDQDITPTVPDVPGVDLNTYKDKLIERFSNPAISDQVQRLAEDGSVKIPNAILPCIAHQLESAGSIKFAVLALAGWFRYLTGVDEDLKPIEITDPRADIMTAAIKVDPQDPKNILGISEVFGTELPSNEAFVTELKSTMDDIHALGTRQTLEKYTN
ncbi:MAG: mannitol dehydrogenase family protein [Pseudomonadota bacterium]